MQWEFSTAETESKDNTSSGVNLQTTLSDNKSHLAEDDNDVINTVSSLERELSTNNLAVLSTSTSKMYYFPSSQEWLSAQGNLKTIFLTLLE